MSQPKFIITADGVPRLGMVNMHKDLLLPGEECIGGGYYQFDYVSNRLIPDRKSYDYGKPKWHWLNVLKVPSVYRGILPGVTVGENAVVCAGSVVTKSIPANEIWVGNPARFMKKIPPKDKG